jgi:hypothetical protein
VLIRRRLRGRMEEDADGESEAGGAWEDEDMCDDDLARLVLLRSVMMAGVSATAARGSYDGLASAHGWAVTATCLWPGTRRRNSRATRAAGCEDEVD